MNSTKQMIFVIFVTLVVTFANANDGEAIRELCRLRFGTFPHPNPALCHLFIQCQVNFYKFWKFIKRQTELFLNSLLTELLWNVDLDLYLME